MSNYLLAKHVFVCRHGAHAIFLDLRADKYFAMEAAKAGQVFSDNAGTVSDSASDETSSPIITLLKQGLLTTDPAQGKEPRYTEGVSVSAEVSPDLNDRAPFRLIDVVRFLMATSNAWLRLRYQTLENVVMHVKRRKESKRFGEAAQDAERVQKLVAIYEHLRPFVFGAKDACLFESLTLLDFLSRYGIGATWVFGVRTTPFAAHCWVQHRNVVLNDSLGHTRGFTPIMAI